MRRNGGEFEALGLLCTFVGCPTAAQWAVAGEAPAPRLTDRSTAPTAWEQPRAATRRACRSNLAKRSRLPTSSAASGGSALRTEHTLTGEARAALAHRSSTLSRKISAAQGSKQIWQA
jgi:hypothetical protein